MEVTTKAVQIFGGYGYKRLPGRKNDERRKITEIYEGTSQVQKMVIAAQPLKQISDESGQAVVLQSRTRR